MPLRESWRNCNCSKASTHKGRWKSWWRGLVEWVVASLSVCSLQKSRSRGRGKPKHRLVQAINHSKTKTSTIWIETVARPLNLLTNNVYARVRVVWHIHIRTCLYVCMFYPSAFSVENAPSHPTELTSQPTQLTSRLPPTCYSAALQYPTTHATVRTKLWLIVPATVSVLRCAPCVLPRTN